MVEVRVTEGRLVAASSESEITTVLVPMPNDGVTSESASVLDLSSPAHQSLDSSATPNRPLATNAVVPTEPGRCV